ncbi:hypothetical protein BASA81_001519 [Batrachochytrium salamandrivorans]|nr:hypothetical protein BASA81_001519 [Batrachochytrium salamandrivorans]
MGQVESQPDPPPNLQFESSSKQQPKPKRKSASDAGANDAASQHSAPNYSGLAGRAAWAPLSWASQGAEIVAQTTVTVAVSTMNVALKTTSAFASGTESAANLAAQNLTTVSLKTANVATQTASLITSATSASVKTAGEAIAGTATLVVEGLTPPSPPSQQALSSSGRNHAASFLSLNSTSPPPIPSPKVRPTSRSHDSDMPILPEAMVALGGRQDTFDSPAKSVVGSRFWGMLGSTNESARMHWVCTVTSTKSTPPSTKYFRKLCILAYETKGQSVGEFYKMLQGRPITTSAICALKALITCLRLVREGPGEALQPSMANVQFVDWIGAFYADKIFRDQSPSSETMNEHMLIARLSGFIVQKMHFHARQNLMGQAMNARYELVDGEGKQQRLFTVLENEDADEEFERLVQLCSALLTLLGTIEGVTRLALTNQHATLSPSPMALLLATLLIEESLGAFDCLSTALAKVKLTLLASDATLVKSLSTRHQNAYEAIRVYCLKALQFPYVVALNKVPVLSTDTLGVVQPRQLNSTSHLSPTPGVTVPTPTASTTALWGFFSLSSTSLPKTTTSLTSATNSLSSPLLSSSTPMEIPNLLRPFTRRSILEGLEEEEKLMDSLVSSSHKNLLLVGGNSASEQQLLMLSGSNSDLHSPVGEDWGLTYSSIDNAKPPIEFEAEDDDYCEDEMSYETELEEGKAVRTATQGNPFDTGNSSIILLAIAHRSAFSGITNPFASGQFTPNNTASNNALLSQPLSKSLGRIPTIQQRKELETSQALEQCQRLFEFSGINLPQEAVEMANEVIGRGAFSVVYRGKLTSTGEEVAVKELSIEEWDTTPQVVMDFRAEVALMKAVHHPNVLRLIGACTSPKLRLVSEYCHHGNLFDFLYFDRSANPGGGSKALTWSLRLRLALGEARGMHFLHTAFPVPLVHRDLKSLNLLLSKTYQLKVSDFGLSRFRSKGGETIVPGTATSKGGGPCGTTHWMAPEVIEGLEEYDEKADIYSFGINLWELCTRRIPWEGEKDVRKLVVSGQRLALNDTVLDQHCPPALLDLIELCWHRDPKVRPDFGAICKTLKRISKTVAEQDKKISGASDY